MGYALDDTARRLANYRHVLRELVHLSCGHLALEPRFEVKTLLGDHIYDDVRAVSKLDRRLAELTSTPGAPAEELGARLDNAAQAATHEYLELAYGELKPTLIAALRIHLEAVDPLLDEPTLRLVTALLHRQERHTAELPAAGVPAIEDLGALPIEGTQRRLRIFPPVEQPARDAFIEVTDGEEPHPVHALMNAELCSAELAARNSHEHPDLPWDFHADMARQTWDEIRHAEVLDRLMATELDCHWGDHPVSFARYRPLYTAPLAERLAAPRPSGRYSKDGIFEYLAADEELHARNAARWR
jgi:hypothetical protein